MIVPTDLQVRLERFSALGLPLLACTVSTGLEGCQRKCTGARFLADSRTLESCRRFVLERTLERKLRVRSWRGPRLGSGRSLRRGRLARRRRLRRDLRVVLRRVGRVLEAAG